MKKCLVCGRKVVSKRKDAIYCRNPRCRKKAFLTRKEQAANAPPPIGPNKASVVVSFPDGSRWLMELTPLQTMEKGQLPTLTQVFSQAQPKPEDSVAAQVRPVDSPPPTIKNSSDQIPEVLTDRPNDVSKSESDAEARAPIDELKVDENGSEKVPAVDADEVSASELSALPKPEIVETPALVPPAGVAETVAAVLIPNDLSPKSTEPELRTVELYFVDYHGRRLAFEAATMCCGTTWRIAPNASARLGFSGSEGMGLGGAPGRWRDVYPHKAPRDCGFVDNVGVLCWEDGERRAYAAETGLLHAAFGVRWPERIREFVAGMTAAAGGRTP